MELLQSGEHEPPALGTAIRNSNPEHLGTDGRTHTSMPQHEGHAQAWDSNVQICPPGRSQGRGPREGQGLSSDPLQVLQ